MQALPANEHIEMLPSIDEQRVSDWNKLCAVNSKITPFPIQRWDKKLGQYVTTNYATVAERLKAFREIYPTGRIRTNIEEHNIETGFVLVRATVWDDIGNELASDTSYEFRNTKNEKSVNYTSYIENASTSAIGRALGIAGFGCLNGIASIDEIVNAKNADDRIEDVPEPSKRKATKTSEKATTKKETTPPPSATQPKQEPLPQGDNKAVGKEVLEQKQAVSHLIEVLSSKAVSTSYVSKAFGVDRLTDLTKEQCAFAEKSAEAFASIERVGVPFERVYKAYKCKKVTDLTDGQLLGIANNANYFKDKYGDK